MKLGKIFDEVIQGHLRQFPAEREAILPFQNDFDVTWAARRYAYGSEFSSYILRPEAAVRDIFGLGIEIALFIFDYDTLEARTFQAINQVLGETPIAGRVEPGTYVLVSRAPNVQKWVSDYLMRVAQSSGPIPISIIQLRQAGTDRYKLRDIISQFAFRRDLFDYRLPIDSDKYFFGREVIISEIQDQIKKSQNTGIFGLRKTGKTSTLYKIQRNADANGSATVIYIDCKSPTIRKKTGEQLLSYLTKEIARRLNIPNSRFDSLDPYEGFEAVSHLGSKKRPICIIFDEIEYISPYSLTDSHWKSDFIDFWQLLWSIQSRLGKLSFIIGGVNAAVCEAPSFSGIQNPLFGIVNNTYVKGLDSGSLSRMITYFGGQMGLDFDKTAIAELEEHYGGHPLLTRMACSYIHKRLEREGKRRPVHLDRAYIRAVVQECDSEIASYCAHVVSEMRDFYPDEYEVLQMAAVGLQSDFIQFGFDSELSKHLRSYGIIADDLNGIPYVSLPVLKGFLRAEHARANGGRVPRALIAPHRRQAWVEDITKQIVRDFRSLLQSKVTEDTPSPFGSRGIPDSDLLNNIAAVGSEHEFQLFISNMYKVFYENIKRTHKERNGFSETFKNNWPALFNPINRIRAYRDFNLHLDISTSTKEIYNFYLDMDTGGKEPSNVKDGWFAMQQAVLDELLYSVQVESASRQA